MANSCPNYWGTSIGIQVVSLTTALPSCGKPDVGRTVYVQEEAQFKTCGANGWEAIDLKGPKGDAGAAGAKGDTGAKGLYVDRTRRARSGGSGLT